MKLTTQETLYHEDYGATLKHKCGKRIVALSLLSFSLIFLIFLFGPFLFFMDSFLSLFFIWASLASFIFFSFGVSSRLVGGDHSLHHPFLTWDNALIMMIITHLFSLQLNNYNSILRTKYDSMVFLFIKSFIHNKLNKNS